MTVVALVASEAGTASRQADLRPEPPVTTPQVRKTSATSYEIGSLRIDIARGEVTVPAVLNSAHVLEFVANATGGTKAYESALTLEADAITFNTALLLIGLDPSRSRPPKTVFDPAEAEGDAVELFMSWEDRTVPIEELLYDERTQEIIPKGRWVYTGSTFVDAGGGRKQYLAELDGVLVGFMHSPSSIIERADPMLGYGAIVTNPKLGLKPETALTLTVRALPRRASDR